jgi:hypothetical protein
VVAPGIEPGTSARNSDYKNTEAVGLVIQIYKICIEILVNSTHRKIGTLAGKLLSADTGQAMRDFRCLST